MGKTKRFRRKLHISNKNAQEKMETSAADSNISVSSSGDLPLMSISDNLFAGINIDIDKIKKNVNVSDDVQSIKSFKSVKSEKSGKKILSKKDKIKLRRELLLKKIDTVNQMKKELKMREKRKNVAVIGDTNPLRDALPSLESLLKSRPNVSYKIPENTKKKAVDKVKKLKKNHIENFSKFKKAINDKKLMENPFEIISNHIQNIVSKEKFLKKKK